MANETASAEPSSEVRFNSWKEIAAYLKCSERTVRRWEEEGLPVHRHPHKAKAGIYAYKAEIDAWWRDGREPLKQTQGLQVPPTVAAPWWTRPRAMLSAALTLVVLFVGFGRRFQWFQPGARSGQIRSLAVLPLTQDLHFRGMYAWNSGTAEGTKNAIGYFQRAIESDPNYADAYIGLALAYAEWRPGLPGPQENMPKAREAALKALALDETLSMGHSVLGSIELYFDWNWAGAEKEFKRALELDPNDYHTQNAYARLLVAMGRSDEALTHVRTTMNLEPLLPNDYPIWITYLAHQYDEALELAKTKSGLDPNHPWYHFDLSLVYEQTGRPTESVEEYLKFETLSGTEPQTIARLRQAFEKSGPGGFWKRRLEEYRNAAKSQYVSNGMVAAACLRAGERECALESLEKAFHERDDLMINLNVDPVFDGIRTDPRFRDLVRRVGLPDGKPQS